MGGSHITVELLSRGHRVVGISRSPGKIGAHSLYEPRPVDLENASIDDIATTLEGLDALICAYGPHSSGVDAMKYSRYKGPRPWRFRITFS
jgi:putative NADH-flavin reductase